MVILSDKSVLMIESKQPATCAVTIGKDLDHFCFYSVRSDAVKTACD